VSRTRFLQDILESVFTREARDAEGTDPFADGADAQPLEALCDALLTERGEISGNRIAAAVLARLDGADPEVERAFFELLATRYDLDAAAAVAAAEAYRDAPDARRLAALVGHVEPRRQELLRRLNRYDGATGELVRLRARLHERLRRRTPDAAALERVDVDFRHLFRAWFNRGFLVLREIDWATPANVLEKIIEYEAVHAINSWEALRARLAPPDRRCYAFFHPAMPDEPLIFVEIALVREMPATVREVLASEREILPAEQAHTAVFYSISNCQQGLAGISFGNSLIKRVAAELQVALPNLERFRTLSPVPGLMRWVAARAEESRQDGAVAPGEAVPGAAAPGAAAPGADAVSPEAIELATALASGTAEAPDEAGRRMLARLVAHYLVVAKRDDGAPLDPVARFHLGNGASLDAVLPEADVFTRGRHQSAGAMVSYLYDLPRVTVNHESYASGRQVALSSEVRALLAPPRRLKRRAS